VESALRCDFAKRGVFLEVELGASAALFESLFKLNVAGTSGAAEIGVLAVATEGLATVLQSDCVTFEQARDLAPPEAVASQSLFALICIRPPDRTPELNAER
jgi:hypothetical protein